MFVSINVTIYGYYQLLLLLYHSQPLPWREASNMAGYSLQGGAVGRGVQWMGVVLCNKLVTNII